MMSDLIPTQAEVAARRFYESTFVHRVNATVARSDHYGYPTATRKQRLIKVHQESRVELQDEAARQAFDLLAVSLVHAEFRRIDAQTAQEA
ncbi:hypothetical protein [Paraburkholderia domus]|uniref:hypothetical protein n=1 Tax=Paraburkholderia domus TaxID=2793075 RepID=UPI001B0A04F3|nr:hypothetical protein [Paraburkholderia domus]CAE6835253.1 hypothetical protein R75483_06887 [Paraburkholderia domus]